MTEFAEEITDVKMTAFITEAATAKPIFLKTIVKGLITAVEFGLSRRGSLELMIAAMITIEKM